MTRNSLQLDTVLGPFEFVAECANLPSDVSLDLWTFVPRLALPPGMAVLKCRAVVLRVTSRMEIVDLRWSCESLAGFSGSGSSGECLDCQEWEEGGYLVAVGTEDEDVLTYRLGYPEEGPYQDWVRYSPHRLEVRIPHISISGPFEFHFIVAENTLPEPVECSAWFAVDILHKDLFPADGDSSPPVRSDRSL